MTIFILILFRKFVNIFIQKIDSKHIFGKVSYIILYIIKEYLKLLMALGKIFSYRFEKSLTCSLNPSQ